MPTIGPRVKQRRCRACGETIAAQHMPWIGVSPNGAESAWHDYCVTREARRG